MGTITVRKGARHKCPSRSSLSAEATRSTCSPARRYTYILPEKTLTSFKMKLFLKKYKSEGSRNRCYQPQKSAFLVQAIKLCQLLRITTYSRGKSILPEQKHSSINTNQSINKRHCWYPIYPPPKPCEPRPRSLRSTTSVTITITTRSASPWEVS